MVGQTHMPPLARPPWNLKERPIGIRTGDDMWGGVSSTNDLRQESEFGHRGR